MVILSKRAQILFASLCIWLTVAAQFNLTPDKNIVREDFNSMGTGSQENLNLPLGWRIDRNLKGPRQVGNWNDASTTVMYYQSENLSSTQSNGTYGFFASQDKNDRAIGGLTTSVDNGTRGINLMTKISNADDSQIITGLSLAYNIEKYRFGSNTAGFSVRLFTSSDGSKWKEAESLAYSFEPDKETAGAPVVPIVVTEIENAFIRSHVEPGQDIYVAWNISVTTGTACASAPGLAIDDIQVSAVFSEKDDDWETEEEPEFIPSGIFLRGEINGWTANSEWEFSKLSEKEYALYNKTISGNFKIADSTWSSNCNYGSNGNNILMDSPYQLLSGTDNNISCGSLSFNCSSVILTIEHGKAWLTLMPNTSKQDLTSVYMVGDFNGWNYMDSSGKLNLDKDSGLFKGRIGLSTGSDGISKWMIYQRLAMAGAWGLEDESDTPATSGVLKAGQKGHVASPSGMYEVSFNINTGEYSLKPMSSEAKSLQMMPEETIIVPVVPDKVKVLSLNNSLIHYNDQAKVFNDIANSMGKDAEWIKHTNLGKTLQYHWEEGNAMTEAGEPGAKMMVRSDVWSHIILQEQTALPRTDFTSFRNSVAQWVKYIRENCPNPNAVIILPLNWALAQDWGNFTDYNNILVDNYNKVAQEYGVIVCPVGIAYQMKFDADGSEKTEKEWFLPGDDRHPTLRATYLAALMEYCLIYDEDPRMVAYFPSYTTEYDKIGGMNEEIADEIRNYVYESLKSYDNVVNNPSSTVRLKTVIKDQYGMELPGENVEYNVSPSTGSFVNGIFTANEPGQYEVTAKCGTLQSTAKIKVTEAETSLSVLPFIPFTSENLDYKQDFDSMGQNDEARLPEGWRADSQLSPRTLGDYRNVSETTLKAGGANFGSTAKNGLWNLGSSENENDRALGGITTDVEGGAKSINIYSAFRNDGDKYLSSFEIEYSIEKYRNGSNPNGFSIQLYISEDGKNWESGGEKFKTYISPSQSTEGAPVVPMEIYKTSGIIEYELAPGGELFIAWNISADSGESCMSAPVVGLDDVTVKANLRPVPAYDHHIYIQNQSNHESTALYAWSNGTPSEILGAWPGQHAIDKIEIDGVSYEVYGHNQKTGNYFLIFNNSNNGSQYDDLAIEGGKDYYLRAKSDNKTLEIISNSIDIIDDEPRNEEIVFKGDSIYCQSAMKLFVYTMEGSPIINNIGNELNFRALRSGAYLVVFHTPDGIKATKLLK